MTWSASPTPEVSLDCLGAAVCQTKWSPHDQFLWLKQIYRVMDNHTTLTRWIDNTSAQYFEYGKVPSRVLSPTDHYGKVPSVVHQGSEFGVAFFLHLSIWFLQVVNVGDITPRVCRGNCCQNVCNSFRWHVERVPLQCINSVYYSCDVALARSSNIALDRSSHRYW